MRRSLPCMASNPAWISANTGEPPAAQRRSLTSSRRCCLPCCLTARESAQEFPVHCEVPRRRDFDAITYERIDPPKCVEGDRRVAVVLDMVGHLPGQKAERAGGVRGACVAKRRVVQGAAGMLGHEKQPKEGLSREHREYPIDQRLRPPQDERCAEYQQIADPETACLAPDGRVHARGHEGFAYPARQRVAKRDGDPLVPIGHARCSP